MLRGGDASCPNPPYLLGHLCSPAGLASPMEIKPGSNPAPEAVSLWMLVLHPSTAQERGCQPMDNGVPMLPYSQLVPGVLVSLGGRPAPRHPARDTEGVTVWWRKVQKGVHGWDTGLLAKRARGP